MFSNSYQSGFVSIFYSVGSNPLAIWDKQVKNGHIRRIIDDEVKSLVLEVAGTNVATTFITCPNDPKTYLGIKLPFLVMIIKNTKKYFSFEIQVKDDKDMHRRFRVSNFQSTTKVYPFCTTMPIGLSAGWNQVQFNLADFTKRAYGSTYLETTRVQIHANVRIRRIYFSDMLYSEEDMPDEFRLYKPTPSSEKLKGGKIESQAKIAKGTEAKKQSGTEAAEGAEAPPPPSPAEHADEAQPAEEGDAPPPDTEIASPELEPTIEATSEAPPTGEEAAADSGDAPAEASPALAADAESPEAPADVEAAVEAAPPATEETAPAEAEAAPEGEALPAEASPEAAPEETTAPAEEAAAEAPPE